MKAQTKKKNTKTPPTCPSGVSCLGSYYALSHPFIQSFGDAALCEAAVGKHLCDVSPRRAQAASAQRGIVAHGDILVLGEVALDRWHCSLQKSVLIK